MNRNLKLLLVAGARPNFMKIAPVIKAIRAHNAALAEDGTRIECHVVHTGQHYDPKMSDIFFTELGIPTPDINLGVGSGSHAVQTASVMTRFETVCQDEKPDWVIVVGDINSTMACTLVCSKMGIKVAHVEAGLRSFDRTMPEEINRIVTDALADLLLTPSGDANENLKREGIADSKIRLVGNVMIDSLIANHDQARKSRVLDLYRLAPQNFIYVTLHRPSNVDQRDNLSTIMEELERISRYFSVLLPVHPRTRKMLVEYGINANNGSSLKIIEPVGYHDSLCLTENARLVLTDSGGLQEESTFFRTPCLTLRPNTERPVTLTIGSNRLTRPEKLARDLDDVLMLPARLGAVPPLWDGHAASRVLDNLVQ